MKKTALQILDETVEYYKKNPRGLERGTCVFFSKDNNSTCAVGRCIAEPALFQKAMGPNGLFIQDAYKLRKHLKEEYQGHDVSFWIDLQKFHDNPNIWKSNNTGGSDLTEYGVLEYKRLTNT